MDKTHDSNLKSWINVDENSDFPIQTIPFGVCSPKEGGDLHVVTAIGDYIIDLAHLDDAGIFEGTEIEGAEIFHEPTLNAFMSMGRTAWKETRQKISEILSEDNPTLRDNEELKNKVVISKNDVNMQLPVDIGDYTDFYSSREHATNVGTMFRGPDAALMPNWLHLPVGYHGRASSVVLSGTEIVRPKGQTKPPNSDEPVFGDCKRLDFELEMGVLIGSGNLLSEPVPIDEAENHVFGLSLINDWSARDVQTWEYIPLGPFLAKNFATSISPWIITLEALEPFRCGSPKQDPEPFDYLKNKNDHNFDIELEIHLQTKEMDESCVISRTNYNYLYWNMAQQLAHHTVNGCNVNVGDMMGSGTISGPNPSSYGSMLEIAWKGTKPVAMPDGSERKFINDHDTVIMRGWSEIEGYPRIGFGDVSTYVHPAKPLQKGKKKDNSLAEA